MERLFAKSKVSAKLIRKSMGVEVLFAKGIYRCTLVAKDGRVKWRDVIHNTVVTVGKNFILDTVLAGSTYTVTGPFMGLITSVDFSAIAAGDTMGSHAGWKEAGATDAPDYTGNRQTMAFDAAANGSKGLSSALAFVFTESGTIKGAFAVLGSGASATKENTGGTLLSAGLFTGGDKLVDTDDTLNVDWTLSV
jgi:hypothetical protein